jgi:hypothetical protein
MSCMNVQQHLAEAGCDVDNGGVHALSESNIAVVEIRVLRSKG